MTWRKQVEKEIKISGLKIPPIESSGAMLLRKLQEP